MTCATSGSVVFTTDGRNRPSSRSASALGGGRLLLGDRGDSGGARPQPAAPPSEQDDDDDEEQQQQHDAGRAAAEGTAAGRAAVAEAEGDEEGAWGRSEGDAGLYLLVYVNIYTGTQRLTSPIQRHRVARGHTDHLDMG